MTSQERMKYLSPSHHHFERVLDPWHHDAFEGMSPEVKEALENGDVINIGPNDGSEFPRKGKRKQIWYSVDWCGNLIGEWGEDTPPGETEGA